MNDDDDDSFEFVLCIELCAHTAVVLGLDGPPPPPPLMAVLLLLLDISLFEFELLFVFWELIFSRFWELANSELTVACLRVVDVCVCDGGGGCSCCCCCCCVVVW